MVVWGTPSPSHRKHYKTKGFLHDATQSIIQQMHFATKPWNKVYIYVFMQKNTKHILLKAPTAVFFDVFTD